MKHHRQSYYAKPTATSATTGLGCFALGALAMYLLDPYRGNRRRAVMRDKLFSTFNQAGCALTRCAEDTANRSRGILAETRAMFRSHDAPDVIVMERVRSAMGRVVSHPSAIAVHVEDGRVVLGGQVLAGEVDGLLSTVENVRGVRGVENRLETHEEPGDEPALQGGSPPPGPSRYGFMDANWPPAVRLWADVGGGALMLWGMFRGGLVGKAAGMLGAGLMARGVTNLEARRLVGLGAGRRAVDVQKTVNINAPLELVFGFFSNYQNFPHFMSNVREVRDDLTGRSHWVVAGPMGMNVEWDADLTVYAVNQAIGWRSVEGATVENAGIIRFQENADGSTRVDVRLSYNPPAGALGHAVARLFGADPKSEMDADLVRVKTLLETGTPAHDAARPLEESV